MDEDIQIWDGDSGSFNAWVPTPYGPYPTQSAQPSSYGAYPTPPAYHSPYYMAYQQRQFSAYQALYGRPAAAARPKPSSVAPLVCPLCTASFTLPKITQHIREEHLRYFPLRCLACQGLRFATHDSLAAHTRGRHKGSQPEIAENLDDELERECAELLAKARPATSAVSADVQVKAEPSDTPDTYNSAEPLAIRAAPASTSTPSGSRRRRLPLSTLLRLSPVHASPKADPRDLADAPEAHSDSLASRPESNAGASELEDPKTPLKSEEEASDEGTTGKDPDWQDDEKRHKGTRGKKTGRRVTCEQCKTEMALEMVRAHILKVHLKTTAISCKFCSFTELASARDIEAHMMVNHPDEDGEDFVDRRVEMWPKCNDLRDKLFPSLAPVKRRRKTGRGLSTHRLRETCRLCPFQAKRHSPDQRLFHVLKAHAADHGPALACRRCDFTAPWALADIRRHFHQKHPGIEAEYDDRREQVRADIPKDFFLEPISGI